MIADPINELGRRLQDRRFLRSADLAYALAGWLAPGWDAPHFNRGLMAKFRRDWVACFRHTLRATELDPSFQPAWWNLGIAATALSDWVVARRAWWQYGIQVPLGSGPPEMNLGSVPIRICPDSVAEVVWCRRLDPARAQIKSVPFPESAHAFDDVVLTDGEPVGHRMNEGREVPVFNELGLLVSSGQKTFQASVVAPSAEDVADLERQAAAAKVPFEDWSTVQFICKACSEGRPHEHDHQPPSEWASNRRLGFAAVEKGAVEAVLSHWCEANPGRSVEALECVFARG